MAEKNRQILTVGIILLIVAILVVSFLISAIVPGLLFICIIAAGYFFLLYR